MKELVTLKRPVTLSLMREYLMPEPFQQQTKHIVAECEGLSDDKKTVTYTVHGYIPLGSERHAVHELQGGPVTLEMRANNVLNICLYQEGPKSTNTQLDRTLTHVPNDALVFVVVKVNTIRGIFKPFAFNSKQRAVEFIATANAQNPSPYKDYSEIFACNINSDRSVAVASRYEFDNKETDDLRRG